MDTTVRDFARQCWAEAVAVAGSATDDDGRSVLPRRPLVGDWEALAAALARPPEEEEEEDFERAYAAAAAAHHAG